MQEEIIFTITIEAQGMRVRYRPHYFADYGHFEYYSPLEPRRRIPISEPDTAAIFRPCGKLRERRAWKNTPEQLRCSL